MTKEAAIKNIANLSALIVGDVMLDSYLFGTVERQSPEAPVPVVLMSDRDERAGGAANVARNVQALGAKAYIATVIGDDTAGDRLKDLFTKRKIYDSACITEKGRITTIKTRILRDSEHMLRVDEETTEDISRDTSKELLNACIEIMSTSKIDVMIFEDYDKGVLTPEVISELTSEAKSRNIPIAVDPKLKGFFNYKNINLFKPNIKELRDGLNCDIKMPEGLPEAVNSLHERLSPDISLTTLGEHGIWIHSPNSPNATNNLHIPCRPCNVIDVSGAGDTVIATAALMLASGATPVQIAEVANLAGGQVCESSGVVTVDLDKLISEV